MNSLYIDMYFISPVSNYTNLSITPLSEVEWLLHYNSEHFVLEHNFITRAFLIGTYGIKIKGQS